MVRGTNQQATVPPISMPKERNVESRQNHRKQEILEEVTAPLQTDLRRQNEAAADNRRPDQQPDGDDGGCGLNATHGICGSLPAGCRCSDAPAVKTPEGHLRIRQEEC